MVKNANMAPQKAENRIDTMTKKQTLLLAAAGASLLAGTQAQAAYAAQDLLLNFRDINVNSSGSPESTVTVDVGNVGSFVTSVAALPGGFAVLDSGASITPTPGYNYSTFGFSADSISALFGSASTGNQIGMTAVAGAYSLLSGAGNNVLWEARQIVSFTGVGGLPDSVDANATAPIQAAQGTQRAAALAINNIGGAITATGSTTLANSSANAAVVPASNGHGFQPQGQAPSNPALISFNNNIPVQGTQEPIELPQDGTGNLYSALWKVPTTTTGAGADQLLGYFTFKPDGEVDFSTQFAAVAPVPEPATYAFFAGLGLLGLVSRRQIRALTA